MTVQLTPLYYDPVLEKFFVLNKSGSYTEIVIGGGSETLDEVLANGSTLTASRDIDIANNEFSILNGSNSLLGLNVGGVFIVYRSGGVAIGFQAASNFQMLIGADGGNNTSIVIDDANQIISYNASQHTFSNGASGTFTSNDGKTITVVSGIITSVT